MTRKVKISKWERKKVYLDDANYSNFAFIESYSVTAKKGLEEEGGGG